jgi:hypothetical protein
MSAPAMRGHVRTACTWFWAWAAVGALATLGVISFGLGPFVVLPAFGGIVYLGRKGSARSSAFGLLAGAGLLLLFVAWLQRRGPLNPLPWLVVGLALLAIGVAAHGRSRRG